MRILSVVVPQVVLASLFAWPAHAQNPDPIDIRACTAIVSDALRLACYDHATHRDLSDAQKAADAKIRTAGVFAQARPDAHEPIGDEPAPRRSLLDSRWELTPESKLGTFNLRSFQPVYVMPVFATSKQNNQPHSPNPNNTAQEKEELDNVEAKFQLSLKTKVWQGVFGDAGDVWVGYTQSSRWQVYNEKQSRPFRESDYEPEAMLVFDTHYQALGWDGRLLGIGINHQSNGRSDPFSRSWNRIVADIGLEREGWTVMLRPWWRIPEGRRVDNNADINDYVGRGEMQLLHLWNSQEFGLTLRHSLRGGDNSHGSARFSWSFPMAGNLRGYLEAFSGYGESLIDYNHNATYLGFGVSLLDWY
jgi:phospholipase A1